MGTGGPRPVRYRRGPERTGRVEAPTGPEPGRGAAWRVQTGAPPAQIGGSRLRRGVSPLLAAEHASRVKPVKLGPDRLGGEFAWLLRFRYLLIDADGVRIGRFETELVDWRVGDRFQHEGHQWRIVELRPEVSTAVAYVGVWVVVDAREPAC